MHLLIDLTKSLELLQCPGILLSKVSDCALPQNRCPICSFVYLSGYVPYQTWAEADPRVTLAVQNSLRSFRHELLVRNFNGIPIMQQHGSADDNVPPFHSRRMNQLISQSSDDPCHEYRELEGKNHWFEGVMSTPLLRKFYNEILGNGTEPPQLPQKFGIVIANPADIASCGGLVVDQLVTPDQLGKIEVAQDTTTAAWVLTTSNILRFHFTPTGTSMSFTQEIIVDKGSLNLPLGHERFECWLVRSEEGSWHVSYGLLSN